MDKWNKTLPFSYFVGAEGLGVAPHLQGGFVLVFKASGRSGSASPKTWPLLGSNTGNWGGGIRGCGGAETHRGALALGVWCREMAQNDLTSGCGKLAANGETLGGVHTGVSPAAGAAFPIQMPQADS